MNEQIKKRVKAEVAQPEREPKKGIEKIFTFPLKQRSVKAISLKEAINKVK